MGVTANPKTSRQNQLPHGKTKYLHGKSKNFTAKPKTSRQKQKNKNLTAKQNRAMGEVINTAEVTSSRLIRKEKQRQA